MRDRCAETRSEDDGVAQRSVGHEYGTHAIGLGPRRLFAESGHIACLQEASLHGDAG